jgi:hypothetical protein
MSVSPVQPEQTWQAPPVQELPQLSWQPVSVFPVHPEHDSQLPPVHE